MLIYVREGVPFKESSVYKPPNDIECGIIEISLKKQKWLLFGIYRPPSQPENYFFEEIGKGLDFHSSKYESICLMGDFNCEPNRPGDKGEYRQSRRNFTPIGGFGQFRGADSEYGCYTKGCGGV